MKKIVLIALNTTMSVAVVALAFAYAQAGTWKSIKLPQDNERVTGMYCASAKACVIATSVFGGAGHLYASDGQKITATLLTGDAKLAEKLGTLGEIGFTGLSKVRDKLIALVDGAGASFVSATGDFTKAASWTTVKIGVLDGGETFGLNQQMGIGEKDGRWVLFNSRETYDTTDAPSPGALWSPLWSPVPPGSVPSNFENLLKADPRLCDSDPGVSISPHLTQPAYVAPDLSVILYPSGARNQRGTQTAGVCLSTDGGKRYYRIVFKGIEDGAGPLGVTCTNSKRCYAYGGLNPEPESGFIFLTNDAQKGADSSWIKAKLPTLRENTIFYHMFFAPDGMNGWAVGKTGSSSALLFASTDGGATWKDSTSSIRALASDSRLHSGYAFDASHLWVGGEKGTLLTFGY